MNRSRALAPHSPPHGITLSLSVPSGDGRNPSPSGEEKFVDVPGGDTNY